MDRSFGADTLTVTRKVEEALADIQRTLPEEVQLQTQVFRQANFIESSIRNLRKALFQGAIIVAIVIVFFLFNIRTALIILAAMPLSLLLGILTLMAFGVGINAMTLAGLVVAVGVVVDNAIIYGEIIFRRLRENRQTENPAPVLQVVFRACREIKDSVVYANWIILVVFGPIFLLTGV